MTSVSRYGCNAGLVSQILGCQLKVEEGDGTQWGKEKADIPSAARVGTLLIEGGWGGGGASEGRVVNEILK